ncbi:Uma2 family endonuclease [Kitasatospora sp. RB6PN24]|uniref:Uma2 family endonuclease n=1 Tax=Kitasatospora humi TaxID=2893891 RepID=UPI001E2DA0D1|nr:Uma2 family endonuclease [Kitasatospora humi]MCC9306912.1 Uma2 family endonuclease [Kitasatospora humi]
MTATAAESDLDFEETPDLDEVLWQAWLALELPEGYRAEIIEGFIEVSPTGRWSHSLVANRLRRALDRFLADSGYAGYQDANVIHGKKVSIPDVMVAAEDVVATDPAGLGAAAEAVLLVAEVVPPGYDDRKRDRVRKRRAYARAGVPVYVVIDDYDGEGHVTVLTTPNPKKATYEAEVRMPYGTPVTIPEGPAKGFVIDTAITGEPRTAE